MEVAVRGIGEMVMLDMLLVMLPGELGLGVRLSRGRSVGGRGAGPGFMNWPAAYALLLLLAMVSYVLRRRKTARQKKHESGNVKELLQCRVSKRDGRLQVVTPTLQ